MDRIRNFFKRKAPAADVISPNTRLFQELAAGNLENISAIIEQEGIDPNTKDPMGNSTLTAAVACKNDDTRDQIIRYLIHQCRCDVNAVTKDGLTPLLQAIFFSKPGTVLLLIEAGADVNYRMYRPGSVNCPIIFASYRNREEILKILVAKGSLYDPLDEEQYGFVREAMSEMAWEIIRPAY